MGIVRIDVGVGAENRERLGHDDIVGVRAGLDVQGVAANRDENCS